MVLCNSALVVSQRSILCCQGCPSLHSCNKSTIVHQPGILILIIRIRAETIAQGLKVNTVSHHVHYQHLRFHPNNTVGEYLQQESQRVLIKYSQFHDVLGLAEESSCMQITWNFN